MKKIKHLLLIAIALCALFPLKVSSQVESKNGHILPPRGTVKILIVFAELVGTCPGNASNNWPSGIAVPPNADRYLDPVVSANPISKLTQYYKDISLGELDVIGDYYPGTIQVPCSSVNPNGGTFNYEIAAINQLNSIWQPDPGDGKYYTAHGLTLDEFDNYTYNGSGLPKPSGMSEGRIDATVFLWRNRPGPGVSCGSGYGVGNFLGPITVGNKGVNMFGSWDFCPDILNDPNNYDGFFTIEFMHSLFGGNNFHTAGGAGSGTFMFDRTASYSTNQGGTSNIVCGWDRNFLDWKGSRQYPISALNQSGVETPSDMTVDLNLGTSYYILRDFVTVGDAIRIKLPHFNWQVNGDKKNQYLWIENHQLINEFDHNKGYTGCSPWAPGVYAYIQAGKDLLEGNNVYGGSNASPNQLNDWLFPLPAEGRWDHYYDFSQKNQKWDNCQWNNFSVPFSIYYPDGSSMPNPFTGYSDLYGFIDSDNDGNLSNIFANGNDKWQPRFEKWTGVPNATLPQASIPGWGDGLDAFTIAGQKIGIGTNPSSTPVLTIAEGALAPNSYDNRSIHLNNLSIEIVSTDYYGVGGSGPKAFLIKVRWDDKAITNDVRWCGNVILENDPLDNLGRIMQIDLSPNKIITIDKGLSPVKVLENTVGSGDFSEPSFLHLLNGTTTTLQTGSQIKVINGSTFHVQSGATLIIGANAKVDIAANSFICIEDGANIVFQDETSKIIVNGIPYGWDQTLINTTLSNTPYHVLNTLSTSGTSPGVTMPGLGNVLLKAGKIITLSPNTVVTVTAGQEFAGQITNLYNCTNVNNYNLRLINSDETSTSNEESSLLTDSDSYLTKMTETQMNNEETEKEAFDNIGIFPNPNNGSFKLSMSSDDEKDIVIYDVMGKVVFEKHNTIEQSISIDITNEAKGIYFVKVITNEGITLKKVVNQ